MAWSSLSNRLQSLPVLLAGPIIRRAETAGVSVWFILKENRQPVLSVYDGNTASSPLMTGTAANGIKLGNLDHVYAYCITAASSSNATLEAGKNYYYDIDFGSEKLSALSASSESFVSFSYDTAGRPSFSLPPTDMNSVRLLHGSCRKAHGEGEDALEAIDTILTGALSGNTLDPIKRPHQLYFTGDQIYADDVADPLYFMVDDAAKTLFGREEAIYTTGTDPKLFFTADERMPGKRNENDKLYTATGFTSMIEDTPECSKSHLLTFQEYAAMYLFAWSDVLWPKTMSDWPDFATVLPKDKDKKVVESMDPFDGPLELTVPTDKGLTFADECMQLKRFKNRLAKIRKALANIPTYMILDDHDITDDWNLNWAWCQQVYSKPLGRRTVQNGLLAYTIFQAWGNTPDRFATGKGRELLQHINDWDGSDGDLPAQMQQLLNIPTLNKDSPPADFVHLPDTIDWHFSYEASGYTIFFLDSRTWRHYPAPDAVAFAGLICDAGFNAQLPAVLPEKQVVLVVAPCPVIDVPFVESRQRKETSQDDMLDSDCESWPLNRYSYEKFFSTLAARLPVKTNMRQGVFGILSGDVHFGFSARAQVWGKKFLADSHDGIQTNAVFAQLVSSAFKNYLSKKCCHGNTCGQRMISEWKNTEEMHINGYPQGLAEPLNNIPVIGPLLSNMLPPSEKRFGFRVTTEGERVVGDRIGFVIANTYPFKVNNEPAVVLTYDELKRQQVTSLSRTDWKYYLDWRLAENTARSTITPTGVHTEPLDSISGLAAYLALAKDHGSNYIDVWGDGKEIVGLNNLGEIGFLFGTTKQINHSLWWRLNPANSNTVLDPFPLSVFHVPLNFDNDKDSLGNNIIEPVFP